MQPYPKHWEADVVLTDGGTAHLRPITPEDGDLLQEFHSRLSPETIYYRFFAPYPKLSRRDVERFTTVDYEDRVALIATIGEPMVAVVRYDKVSGDEAEVAFVVEDSHQGRGIASVLLEHIGAAARERGVRRFIADVLPENRRMINVFREAGYTAQQTFDEGVIRLTLDLEPTEDSRDVMRAREQRAESRSIARLLFPESVAVIGASRTAHTIGQTSLRNLIAGDFQGPVFPVHPEAKAVAGVRAYPSVLDIPDPVDLAIVAVRADMVADVVDQCAQKGVYGLVVVSSGFGEAGPDGRARQDELVRTARAAGMRVIGPNCLGIANTDPAVSLNATLSPDIPSRGRIGFFSQSGALGRAILQRVAQRGMGLSTFVSAGNRADVSGNDLMQYWEEDPGTEVVLQYLESLGNPRKFSRLARRLAQHKPVVAVRTGGSSQGVPTGHAANALALPDYAVTSLFQQAGVVRVEDITQMFDVAQLFAYQPLPSGPRVGIVGNSDSLGLLAKDACLRSGLRPHDPVDLGPTATAADFDAALSAALADESVHSVVVVFIPALTPISSDVAEVMRAKAAASGKPIVTTYLGYQGLPEELRQVDEDGETLRGSVPSYPAPEDAVRALAHATRYAMWRERDPGRHPELAGIDRAAARRLIGAALADAEAAGTAPHSVWFTSEPVHNEETAVEAAVARRLLDCYGVQVWTDIPVASGDAAVAAAEELGYPVVVKANAPDLRLRSGGSGIRADLRSPEDVRGAYIALHDRLGDDAMLVVQRMAVPGVPTVIRAGENPSFGSVVAFGLADVTAELLDDRAYRLAPLTDADAADLVRAVRSSPLLFGLPAGASSLADQPNVEALEELLIRVSRLVDALPEVTHVDLDPVIVNADGAHVLGARVWLREAPEVRLDYGPRRLRVPY
ncbi:acyl-CoA synthetase (NDP forming)/RimJ/RimL family protein N-acetyltransferase [Spinactinospora alkalitolerans]|uniref:Acyl-CoA synthetase (NDP forming)/RimJ/RimL family protein N-acetyltransferase n=1 Tax=Spinactinospora alkalitolerans TaxID=687207 RepID=A0A852TUA4_9ACTN|nr:GNAT family N-acetyltransferase [Spinactinospora alkalitolerans]NYE46452.1 acyl-CoA synthetase (NDP forming)/RimJ/RimL family protein N-acetyltransferase [Spinactinospora alkalitolerans]